MLKMIHLRETDINKSQNRVIGKHQRGFSLLEVMIASALMFIGLFGMVGMQVQTMKYNSLAADLTLASNIAASRLEDLRLRPFTSVTSTAVGDTYYSKYGVELRDQVAGDGAGAQGRYFNTDTTVVDNISYKDIDIRVSWGLNKGGFSDATHQIRVYGRIDQ